MNDFASDTRLNGCCYVLYYLQTSPPMTSHPAPPPTKLLSPLLPPNHPLLVSGLSLGCEPVLSWCLIMRSALWCTSYEWRTECSFSSPSSSSSSLWCVLIGLVPYSQGRMKDAIHGRGRAGLGGEELMCRGMGGACTSSHLHRHGGWYRKSWQWQRRRRPT